MAFRMHTKGGFWWQIRKMKRLPSFVSASSTSLSVERALAGMKDDSCYGKNAPENGWFPTPVALASAKTPFIDDHSRLIVHGAFYLSENLFSFMNAFEKALAKRGLPRKLYVDNGAAFRSHKLAFTCASPAISLIHARPYKPQWKGKIERFFKTLRGQFLPTCNTGSLAQLNQDFHHWLENTYHQRTHSATGMTPFERFTSKLECIRKAPKNLKDHFRKAVYRTVFKDRTITLCGRLFEAPVALIGKRVLLLYHENEPEKVEVFFNQISYGLLVPVDLHVNCRIKRDKYKSTKIESDNSTVYKGGDLWKWENNINSSSALRKIPLPPTSALRILCKPLKLKAAENRFEYAANLGAVYLIRRWNRFR